MTITRRNVLLGATATAAMLPIAARAQASEVVVGLTYPFSGANAQIVSMPKGVRDRAEIINKKYDLICRWQRAKVCPPRRRQGPPGVRRPPIDPQKGRAETERLITQEKVCAVIGTYQSASRSPSPDLRRYQVLISADNSSRACIAAA